MNKMSLSSSLFVQVLGFLFHWVVEVTLMDSRTHPVLVLSMDSCLIIDIFWGGGA